jgi:hypothetical protein
MRTVIIALCLSASLSAQSLKLAYAAVVVGNAADLWTTQQAFGRGAVEGNPLVAGRPPVATLAVAKVAITTVVLLGMRSLANHGHPRVAAIVGWLDGAGSMAIAAHNNRVNR